MIATTEAPPVVRTSVEAAAAFVGVSKTYRDGPFRRRGVEALRDVSLRIEPAEVVGLLGPNRAGKTTLVKLLLSLCQPTSGEVFRLGKPLSDRTTLGQVGYVHENHAFPRYLSAATLLEYYGALTLLPPEVVRECVPQLLERVGLADRSREPIARFSKGMVLIRDTLRQSRTAGVFWLMLAVSLLCVALCLTATVVAEGPDDPGRLDMAFGAVQVTLDHGRADAVRTLEVYLAGGVADAIGLLLALMWTASFLPSFLEANTASVLLVKPVSRGSLLLGKCLGVLAFVAVQDGLFVGGTWLALGLRTGIWDTNYVLCLPLLLLHFAVFFSFSAMLAAATRSTVACVFGSILFWLLCWAMNFGRHALLLSPDLQSAAAGLGHTVEFGYWLLPKPLDGHLILRSTLQDNSVLAPFLDTQALAERGAWQPVVSVLASCACALVLLALATYEFVTAEY